MPDPTPVPAPLTSNGLQIANVVMNGLMTLLITYLTFLGQRTHSGVETVQAVQQQSAENTQTVKETLDKRIESDTKKAKESAQTTAINLWSVWTYLDHVAAESGLQKDRDKANEARRVYDKFVKENPQ